MTNTLLTLLLTSAIGCYSYGQGRLVDVETKSFETTRGIDIEGEVGYLEVPENRSNPSGRTLRLKYIRLKSIAENPAAPVIYLEGGGNTCTWQAEDPEELSYWIELLEVSDLIFIDQRGTSDDESMYYIWQDDFPEDFFVTEEAANAHYKQMVAASLVTFEERGIDVKGYTIEEHANDVNKLMTALQIDRYSIFGFSFGTHIGMTVLKLFPDRIDKAILVGADAPNQAFNFPSYLDLYVQKLSARVAADANLIKTIPDFEELVYRVMEKLEKEPAVVTVKNPLTGEDMPLKIGAFGFGMILRLDIDDYNDIGVIPRLVYTVDQGDYSMLTFFAQKRIVFSLALPASGINQQLASGADEARWTQIEKEAQESAFGNVVNFPFSAAKDYWVANELSFDPSIPMESDVPTLFITGDLDCRTPVEQVEETKKGFSNAIHIVVENAGHEQAMWDKETANETIPAFLRGEAISEINAYYADIDFIKVTGKGKGHPSLN